MDQSIISVYSCVQGKDFSFVPKKSVFISFMAPLLCASLYYILHLFLFSLVDCKLPKNWGSVLYIFTFSLY